MVRQISHLSTSLLILSLAEKKTKEILWNLFNMPATPLCPDVILSWQILNASFNLACGRQMCRALHGLVGFPGIVSRNLTK